MNEVSRVTSGRGGSSSGLARPSASRSRRASRVGWTHRPTAAAFALGLWPPAPWGREWQRPRVRKPVERRPTRRAAARRRSAGGRRKVASGRRSSPAEAPCTGPLRELHKAAAEEARDGTAGVDRHRCLLRHEGRGGGTGEDSRRPGDQHGVRRATGRDGRPPQRAGGRQNAPAIASPAVPRGCLRLDVERPQVMRAREDTGDRGRGRPPSPSQPGAGDGVEDGPCYQPEPPGRV